MTKIVPQDKLHRLKKGEIIEIHKIYPPVREYRNNELISHIIGEVVNNYTNRFSRRCIDVKIIHEFSDNSPNVDDSSNVGLYQAFHNDNNVYVRRISKEEIETGVYESHKE